MAQKEKAKGAPQGRTVIGIAWHHNGFGVPFVVVHFIDPHVGEMMAIRFQGEPTHLAVLSLDSLSRRVIGPPVNTWNGPAFSAWVEHAIATSGIALADTNPASPSNSELTIGIRTLWDWIKNQEGFDLRKNITNTDTVLQSISRLLQRLQP